LLSGLCAKGPCARLLLASMEASCSLIIPMPGATGNMDPRPDHGETSYKGSGRLKGMRAVITGGDSGIGCAVAIAYAREGADVLIAYLSEYDAKEVKDLIEKEGRRAVLVSGDLRSPGHCRAVIQKAVDELGGIYLLVNNAVHQQRSRILAISATRRHQSECGGARPDLDTPHSSTMPDEAIKNFGKQVPMKRAGQPAELATAYVMLADPLSSYTSSSYTSGTQLLLPAASRSSERC
jgi:NAD(P)-dependent dehydrogenase (short-subunit alcohol dehydrogenase family)